MKRLLLLICAVIMLTSCTITKPTENNVETSSEVKEVVEEYMPIYAPVPSFDESQAEGMTEVESYPYFFLSDEEEDEIVIYTSAEKSGGKFHWDDSNKFVIEIKGADGKYYTLFNDRVSMGAVYYDIVMFGEDTYILLKNISTAADYIETYTVHDGVFCKTDALNLNSLRDLDANLIYTSVPLYR